MPVPPSSANVPRSDPYKRFPYRVIWNGRYVAGVYNVGGLVRANEVDAPPEDGDPGRTMYDTITLERGFTHDLEFETWCNKVWALDNSSGEEPASLKDFRKDIIIEFYNEAGQKVHTYHVYRCWVSDLKAAPDLDGSDSSVAIESIRLANEGWELVTSVAEPAEPDP